MSMAIATLLHLGTLLLGVALPGLLLWRGWLAARGFSWRVSLGLSFAALTVIFIAWVAIVGYSLAGLLVINLMALSGAVIVWWRGRAAASAQNPGAEQPGAVWFDWFSVFQMLIVAFFMLPAFALFLPLNTDAQGFGYIALMLREGGTINTLAPWHPEVRYLYSPAIFIWWAYLSDLLGLPLHQVMLPFTHLAAALMGLLSIDLGLALDRGTGRLRWLLPLGLMAGTGLFTALLDSHYTSVLAFCFVTLFLGLLFRAITDARPLLLGAAALALACVPLSHPDTVIILLAGYLPFYLTYWLAKDSARTWATWLRLFVLIPVAGMLLTLPWLIRSLPLFFEPHIYSPFVRLPSHWEQLVAFQGYLVPALAAAGVVLALHRRRISDLFMFTWLLMIWDLALFGVSETVINALRLPLTRYVYPFSVGWHGPILGYACLAAFAADWALDRWPLRMSAQTALRLNAVVLGLGLLLTLFNPLILQASFEPVNIFGAFSSKDDVALFDWMREELPQDVLVLNYPIGLEGHWVAAISERESVEFRPQYFFSQEAWPLYDRSDALVEFYFDPATPGAYEAIRAYGVTHLLYPQLLINPEPFGDMQRMMRWRWPHEWRELTTAPDDIPWLQLVKDIDGARLYEVTSSE